MESLNSYGSKKIFAILCVSGHIINKNARESAYLRQGPTPAILLMNVLTKNLFLKFIDLDGDPDESFSCSLANKETITNTNSLKMIWEFMNSVIK